MNSQEKELYTEKRRVKESWNPLAFLHLLVTESDLNDLQLLTAVSAFLLFCRMGISQPEPYQEENSRRNLMGLGRTNNSLE